MREVKFRFGDIIENGWAGERNPTRKGIFVRHKKRTIELTDGKGKFWEVYHNKDHKNFELATSTKIQNYWKQNRLLFAAGVSNLINNVSSII